MRQSERVENLRHIRYDALVTVPMHPIRITLSQEQIAAYADQLHGLSQKVDAKLQSGSFREKLATGAHRAPSSPAQITSADAAAIRNLVGAPRSPNESGPTVAALRLVLNAREMALQNGDILSHTMSSHHSKEVHEITQGVIDVPLLRLIGALGGVDKWACHLHGLHGLDTQVVEEQTIVGADGKRTECVKYQVERMKTRSDSFVDKFDQYLGDFLPGGYNDMTKLEVAQYGTAGHGQPFAAVQWEVVHSDNGSTLMDIGEVRFTPFNGDSTLMTYESVHRLNAMPEWGEVGKWISESPPGVWLVRRAVGDFFHACVKKMQRDGPNLAQLHASEKEIHV